MLPADAREHKGGPPTARGGGERRDLRPAANAKSIFEGVVRKLSVFVERLPLRREHRQGERFVLSRAKPLLEDIEPGESVGYLEDPPDALPDEHGTISYTLDQAYCRVPGGAARYPDDEFTAYMAVNNELSKLQMIDAFRVLVPYSQTLSHNIAFDAYFSGHESGSRHAWGQAKMEGAPPQWPDDGPNGEIMEPDEDEQDPAIERDTESLEATVEKYGEFLPELLDRLERELATDALSLWEGFVAFCDESVGVPAESVTAVVLEPVADRIEDLKDRARRLELEAKAETVEEIREGLAESWRVVEERGV